MSARGAALALAGCLIVARAIAAEQGEADRLFREGRRLMSEGDLAAACPMLAKSVELEASSGALLNLARCHELQGMLATAWTDYLEAERVAVQQGKLERAEEARTRAAALLPRVPTLVIKVEDTSPGHVVLRDDQLVPAASYGAKLQIDPGTHVVTVTAPDRRGWKISVTLGPNETREIVVPALEPIAVAPPPPSKTVGPPPPPPPAPTVRGASPWPWIVGGTAVVLLGVGTWAGVGAIDDYRAADRACPRHLDCSASALDARERAGTKAWIANVGIGVGVVAAAGATWLFLRTGDAPRTGLVVGGPSLAYVGYAGSF